MRTYWTSLAAGVALALTTSSVARADDRYVADTFFREGRRAADAGDYATAYAKFVESQHYDPAVGTLLNLSDCEEHLGRLADALARYRGVLHKLRAGDDRTAFVTGRIAELQKTVQLIALVAPLAAPAGMHLRLDGNDATASLGAETPVDAGKHVLVTEAPGREPKPITVLAKKGEVLRIQLELGAALATAEPPRSPSSAVSAEPPSRSVEPAASPSARSGVATAGYVTGGLGIVGLAVGAVTGGMVLGKKSTVASHCDAAKACDQEGLDAGSAGKTLSTVSTVAFVLGAAAVAGGVTLVILGHSSNSTTALHTTVSPWRAGLSSSTPRATRRACLLQRPLPRTTPCRSSMRGMRMASGGSARPSSGSTRTSMPLSPPVTSRLPSGRSLSLA